MGDVAQSASAPVMKHVILALLALGALAEDLKKECAMDALQLIHYWGYHGEEHTVVTDDHYVLTVQRIPYGKAGPSSGPRPVVFFQHGLEGSATNWLTNLPDQSAAYIFADAGYDVWLGNFRGNTYSNRHLDPSISKDKYWQFSWDEMALSDLPAMIQYALDTSGQSSLYYVGHSEGTMTPFALFSKRPDWAKSKVKRFFALGPVATVGHIAGFLQIIAKFDWPIEKLLEVLGVHDFVPATWLNKYIGEIICGNQVTDRLICENIFFMIGGGDTHNLNATRLEVYAAHNPAGTSTQNIVHFAQGVNSDKFLAFDYGSVGNLEHYGTLDPYKYDLTKVSVPTYLFWGNTDTLADKEDVYQTIIPNVPTIMGNYGLNMSHLDFIFGLHAPAQVYQPILDIIAKDQ